MNKTVKQRRETITNSCSYNPKLGKIHPASPAVNTQENHEAKYVGLVFVNMANITSERL